MSEQELKALEALLPSRGGNRAFDRGVVEALEAALKALEKLPAESIEPLRSLHAKAVAQEAYHQAVFKQLDTPESRQEIEERLAKIYSGEIQMVPLEPILREMGIFDDEVNDAGNRNGSGGHG